MAAPRQRIYGCKYVVSVCDLLNEHQRKIEDFRFYYNNKKNENYTFVNAINRNHIANNMPIILLIQLNKVLLHGVENQSIAID